MEEHQPPKLRVTGSNPVERASFFLLLLAVGSRSLAASPSPLWGVTGARLAPTSSLKWGVAVVADGAGGAVLAWEENRGRKICCRDTRDLFLQRLDGVGKPLWGDADVRLAEADPGEEILGMAPAGDGGALLLWHRGGRLMEQVIGSDGARTRPEPGAVLRDGDAAVEWYPYHAFAMSPDGSRCAVAWAERRPDGTAMLRLLRLTRSGVGWSDAAPVAIATEAGLHPSAVSAAGAGWLVCWWLDRPAGAELWGRMFGGDGRPAGPGFRVGVAEGLTYVHAEATPSGGGGAWIAWSALVPEEPGKFCEIHVALAERGRVRAVVAGQAKTQVLFIPSTHVTVGLPGAPPPTGLGQAATPEFVSWRRSWAILAAGRSACAVAWLDGKAVSACRVSAEGGKPVAGPASTFGREVFAGFAPVLLSGAQDGVSVCWSEKSAEDHYRILRRRIGAGPGSEAAADELVAEEDGVSPRACTSAGGGPDAALLAWTAIHKGEWGVVRAQRVALP